MDNSSKHTPGPWRYIKNTGIVAGDECHIGYIGNFKDKELLRFNKDRWETDARLIAAAPDLLEALEKLMDLGTGYGEASDLIRIICKPAIAKAKGE